MTKKVAKKVIKEPAKKMTQEELNHGLTECAKNGDLAGVKKFLKLGADINADDCWALRSAACQGHLNVVKYMVDNGVDIHAFNDRVLKIAVENGYLEVVKYLVEHGADVNANNAWALESAIYYGYSEIAEYLKSKGAKLPESKPKPKPEPEPEQEPKPEQDFPSFQGGCCCRFVQKFSEKPSDPIESLFKGAGYETSSQITTGTSKEFIVKQKGITTYVKTTTL